MGNFHLTTDDLQEMLRRKWQIFYNKNKTKQIVMFPKCEPLNREARKIR